MLFAIGSNLLLGLLLLALMGWLLRPDAATLAGPEEAAAIFARLQPGHRMQVTLAADGRAALLELGGSVSLGLVERRGRRWNARLLAPGDLAALREEAGGVLRLEFADFGWPAARVALSDGAGRERWMDRLRAFVAAADAGEARDAG